MSNEQADEQMNVGPVISSFYQGCEVLAHKHGAGVQWGWDVNSGLSDFQEVVLSGLTALLSALPPPKPVLEGPD